MGSLFNIFYHCRTFPQFAKKERADLSQNFRKTQISKHIHFAYTLFMYTVYTQLRAFVENVEGLQAGCAPLSAVQLHPHNKETRQRVRRSSLWFESDLSARWDLPRLILMFQRISLDSFMSNLKVSV
jgi:hypothetical protein